MEINTRDYSDSRGVGTVSQSIPAEIHIGDRLRVVDVSVEYRPKDSILNIWTMTDLDLEGKPEEAAVNLYRDLCRELFPGYADRDEPWSVAPLMLEMTLKFNGGHETVTVGQIG